MPFLSMPTRRRDFLASIGAAALVRGAETPVRLALLSDTHAPDDPADAQRGFRPYDNLKQVVGQVIESGVEAAYVNGDLARNRGTEGEYRSFRELTAPLAARMPLALGLGNHDHRDQFLASMRTTGGERQAIRGKFVSVLETRAGVRLVFLDSQFIPLQVPGLLGKAQRSWLDEYLSRDARPTVLFVHHTLGDDDGGLLDADRLLQLASARKHVKAIFYGHSHRYQVDTTSGLHLVNLPAVGYNFADDQPVGWVEATLTTAGCELRLHAIGGNRDGDGKTRSISWRA